MGRITNKSTEISPESPHTPRSDCSQRDTTDVASDIPHAQQICSCLICQRETPLCLRKRRYPTWDKVIRVVFYCLSQLYPSKKYFSLKDDVYNFVEEHWSRVCLKKRRADHWRKSMQDTISHSNLFESGVGEFKKLGYWRPLNLTDPWADDAATHPAEKRAAPPIYDSSSESETKDEDPNVVPIQTPETDYECYHPQQAQCCTSPFRPQTKRSRVVSQYTTSQMRTNEKTVNEVHTKEAKLDSASSVQDNGDQSLRELAELCVLLIKQEQNS
ncbi:histidine kinase [Pelomyxa schiedti]|nr:histidine kinase [Pelomyxa schiedti]